MKKKWFNSRVEYFDQFVNGRKVLDLGVVQHDAKNRFCPNWVHQHVEERAAYCLGLDYNSEGVQVLNSAGFNVRCEDVQNFDLGEKFEVIVCGELIEHLTSFNDFFSCLDKHLDDGGVILFTTPNVFYFGFFMASLLGNIDVNKEHICWFDDITLRQLCERQGFEWVQTAYVGRRLYKYLPVPLKLKTSVLAMSIKRSTTAKLSV